MVVLALTRGREGLSSGAGPLPDFLITRCFLLPEIPPFSRIILVPFDLYQGVLIAYKGYTDPQCYKSLVVPPWKGDTCQFSTTYFY